MAAGLATFLFIAGAVTVAAEPVAAPPGYKMVWHDEFAGALHSAPDARFWNHETGANGWGNQELQNYVSDVEHAQIVADPDATDGKALQILASSEGPGKFTSARLQTFGKAMFQYGYFEARIRIPYGQGIWPAFWLLGADLFISKVGWPGCGEIDIMENIGKKDWWGKNEGSLHGPGYNAGGSLHAYSTLPEGKYFKDAYHTFAILWSRESVAFSVDGKVYETRTPADLPGKKWVFDHPFFFIVDVAVGGRYPGGPDATTTFPQRMLIDYVRVYQNRSGGADAPRTK